MSQLAVKVERETFLIEENSEPYAFAENRVLAISHHHPFLTSAFLLSNCGSLCLVTSPMAQLLCLIYICCIKRCSLLGGKIVSD